MTDLIPFQSCDTDTDRVQKELQSRAVNVVESALARIRYSAQGLRHQKLQTIQGGHSRRARPGATPLPQRPEVTRTVLHPCTITSIRTPSYVEATGHITELVAHTAAAVSTKLPHV